MLVFEKRGKPEYPEKCWFLRRGENRSTRRKTSRSKDEKGAPANRATRLGGLKHSPLLHASHLGEIVSRAAANHNKQDGGQQKRFGGKLLFFITRYANGRFSVSRAIILHCTN